MEDGEQRASSCLTQLWLLRERNLHCLPRLSVESCALARRLLPRSTSALPGPRKYYSQAVPLRMTLCP